MKEKQYNRKRKETKKWGKKLWVGNQKQEEEGRGG
jgi:hypothetical protein